MTVAQRFQELLRRIQPLSTEIALAESHANTIKGRLMVSFNVKKFLAVGSHARGSAIRHSSDLDLFVLIPSEMARWRVCVTKVGRS